MYIIKNNNIGSRTLHDDRQQYGWETVISCVIFGIQQYGTVFKVA